MGWKAFLAIVLMVLLVYVPVAPAASPAVVGKISTKGTAEVNGAAVPAEATVFAGDRISTQKNTASGLSLPGGNQVFLPALTSTRISRTGDQVTVALERGAVAVVNRSADPVVIEANGVLIQAASPAGGVYEVAIQGRGLKVMARKGTAVVKAADRTVEVKEGTTMDATVAPGPAGSGGTSSFLTIISVVGAAAGVTGLVLGVQALRRSQPQNCVVISPSTISCP